MLPLLTAAFVVAVGAALLAGGIAHGATYAPKPGKVFHGVSDTGDIDDIRAFNKRTRAHSAVVQGFETWGAGHDPFFRRLNRTRSRGQLHISTAPGYAMPGVKTPKEIATDEGDAYILRLNRDLGKWGDAVYIRLMAEMNGHWNDYSGFNSDGSPRPERSPRWYRKAWQRFTIVIRGGWTAKINRKLRRQNLPVLRAAGPYKETGLPKRIPEPKVAMQWVPQTHGSPNLRANQAKKYWPGGRYVDWVGVDTYSRYPAFRAIGRFYKEWKRKPFVIGEYGVWGADKPRWVRRFAKWVRNHRRVRLVSYYQDFGKENPHRIQQFPRSLRTLRKMLNEKRYKAFAPGAKERSKIP